ncbi:MAG: glycoside hydrolase family 127 protein [Sphingomicrobium sp.]
MLVLSAPVVAKVQPGATQRVAPVPARFVRLKPSVFADAFEANRRFLLSLDPQRLLHNFYVSAGLPPQGPAYGGWEAQGIAGHSFGHWLSGCSLAIANTENSALTAKLDHALGELARIQAAHRDGYVGGTTVRRDGKTVDGKIVFEEIRRGDIRSQGFDLNGGWVPIYAWHKVQAGLIDAHKLAKNERALPILLGMAGYLATIVEGLSDAQVQIMLRAEHGGINEAFAETYAITGNRRWLNIAEKLRHKAVLDPLTAQRDILPGLHANTQIPKVIGLARLHELTGSPAHAAAARFFHRTVTGHHSYVIGGNSDREHFGKPGQLQGRITDATCEACNSYNMLRLTRHLYGWRPHAEYFDYYERVQLNHMLAHQRPDSGMFAYFMPMVAGGKRKFSTPDTDFWCCVGSGMESHAKHADSIYWTDRETLYVNLFIPSALEWAERGLALDLDTKFPMEGEVRMTVRRPSRASTDIAIRLPVWAHEPTLRLNGKPAQYVRRDGYAVLKRRWKAGDRIDLSLPMILRSEPIPGDPSTVAFLSGPLVVAADLGPADREFDGAAPALLVDGAPAAALMPVAGAAHQYRAAHVLGGEFRLRPFFPMYDRRTAVYFKSFTVASWSAERDAYLAAEAVRADLARRTIDVFHIGEQQPEQDHAFTATKSEADQFFGKSSRRISLGESMTFRVARRPGPSVLQLTYVWFEIDREIEIQVDGKTIAVERRTKPPKDDWVVVDYPLVPTGAPLSEVRIKATKGDIAIYGVRVLAKPTSVEVMRSPVSRSAQ